jgi:hypothetical protein
VNPANTNSITWPKFRDAPAQLLDSPNHFVSEHDRQSWGSRSTLDLVEFGVAHAASGNPDKNLARPSFGRAQVDEFLRRIDPVE